MSKIITFSLFGNKAVYCQGAIENVKLATTIYPGWRCRIYYSNDVPQKYIKQLQELQCELRLKTYQGKYDGTMWRFEPLDDPTVKIWISRDCDSRLNLREKYAVEDWLETDKSVHIMRDAHDHRRTIMAGMFGINNEQFRKKHKIKPIAFYSQTLYSSKKHIRDVDQQFLKDVIWPLVRSNDHIAHDDNLHYRTGNERGFTYKLPKGEYIGQVFDIDNKPITVKQRRTKYGI